MKGNVADRLIKIIESVLPKVRNDIRDETLDYFLARNLKLGRSYLLPKIHKRLINSLESPVIFTSWYYLENISAFLEYHPKPKAQKVRLYI